MPLFSVIIPHYNSVSLLKQLLESIPVDEAIQVIVVDDKSTECLAGIENQVTSRGGTFLHNATDKKGAGTCRNIGLAQATGKWLVFADADDYFLDGAFDVMKKNADSKANIIYYPPTSVYKNSGTPAKRHIPYERLVRHYLTTQSEKNELLLRYKFMSPCSKMIRRNLVKEKHISFDEVPASNDVMFSMQTAYHAKTISASLTPIYCITSAPNTLTTQKNGQNYWSRVEVFVRRYHFMQSNLDSGKYKFLLPTGILVILKALRQKYDPAFIYKIYIYLRKNHVKMFSFHFMAALRP